MQFASIKIVYPMVNKSVSVACFLLAASFNNRRGYARMPTNLYRSNFNVCTNSWLTSLFWQVRRL